MKIFSIITVCYNAAAQLPGTIESVLQQDIRDQVEYIIIDGASTDRTAEVLTRYQGQIDKVVSEPDKGIYDAMNKGARLATGQYVLMLNAGDRLYAPDTLRRVAERLYNDINKPTYDPRLPDVVYGDVAKNGVIKVAEPPHNGHRMYFCHQCVFVRTDAQKQHPFDISHRMSADFKLFKQLWQEKASFYQLNFPIAHFDTTGVSNSRREDGIRDNISVVKELDHGFDRLRILTKLYFQAFLCQLRSCLKHKNK